MQRNKIVKKNNFKKNFLKKFLNFFKKNKKENNLEEDIKNFLNRRIQNKLPLKIDEEQIISNVFELPEKLISNIMVPRSDIISIDENSTLSELIKLIGRTNHSRYPVHEKNRDNIIGMVHIKDAVSSSESIKKIKIKKLIRKILFAPPSMTVLDLILKMRVSHTHMAIVIDEHGGVDGLVTIEDLVEEIVGEIKDEHDAQKEKKKEIHSEIEEGKIVISARMQIKQFEKKYGKILFNKKDFNNIDTMGGLVFTLSGRIPLKGEIIKHSTGCEFEILEADTRRIKKILIRNHRML